MRQHTASFRFYAELNDLLPGKAGPMDRVHAFHGSPSVKDAIEAQGIPHTEVDLILANGRPVDFAYRLRPGDRIAVYPVFESLDIAGATPIESRPLRHTSFVLDVHLGKLARTLRLLGFDCLYRNDLDDLEIIDISRSERRIILTRDRGLLKHAAVTHGCCLRAIHPWGQVREVLDRFHLWRQTRPFSRCPICNTAVEAVEKQAIAGRLPPRTREAFDEFYLCPGCDRIYWKGSHYEKLRERLEELEASRDERGR